MRIEGPKDLKRTQKKSSTKSKSGTKFVIGQGRTDAGLTGTSATQNINNIGALLTAQEVSGTTEQAKFAVKRGSDMLDMLDELKIGLLNGRVSPVLLHQLKLMTAEKQNLDQNEGLKKVMTSIELRAEVELAKLARQKSK